MVLHKIHPFGSDDKRSPWQSLKENGINDPTIQRIIEYIDQNHTEKLTVQQIANSVGYCSRHAQRLCKQKIGYTIHDLINFKKMDIAASFLQEGTLKIQEVALKVGYRNASHFASAFRRAFKMNPSDFARKSSPTNIDDRKNLFL